LGLDHVDQAWLKEFSVKQVERVFEVGTEAGVPPPIGGDEVEAAIGIEVGGGDAIPPTGPGFETPGGGLFEPTSIGVSAKDADRSPFGGEDQFRGAVASEIGEQSATDHAGGGEGLVEVGVPVPGA
jgi:hypothetical protein